MKKKGTEAIADELEAIAKRGHGVLKPEAVVKYAKNVNTALHSRFTWDDSKAAHGYRLWQAREIITTVVIKYDERLEPMRAYVSLVPDRTRHGGGYRSLANVMANSEMRAILLQNATDDLNLLRLKYGHLKELAKVFEAAEKVKTRRRRRR